MHWGGGSSDSGIFEGSLVHVNVCYRSESIIVFVDGQTHICTKLTPAFLSAMPCHGLSFSAGGFPQEPARAESRSSLFDNAGNWLRNLASEPVLARRTIEARLLAIGQRREKIGLSSHGSQNVSATLQQEE